MDIIPDIYSKILTKDNNFANYLLIMDDYYELPRLYGTENTTSEEVTTKLDMFQDRFGKVATFGW